MANRLFVSNRDESVRLFKNPILEYFSHIHPATPVIVYVPVSIISIYYGFLENSIGIGILFLVIGILLWTFFEYFMHRFVFHYEPKSQLGQKVHFLAHGVHHDYPRDRTRLVMPLLVSVPLALLFYFFYTYLFPVTGLFIFSGFVMGYVAYDTIHYATHHFKMTSSLGRFLKEYHLKHHYVDPKTAYGVSNPAWDYVFFTVPKKGNINDLDKQD